MMIQCLLLLLVISLVTVLSYAAPQSSSNNNNNNNDNNNNPIPTPLPQRFPRNLFRLYDGTWDVSDSAPFNYIPSLDNKNSNDSSSSSPSSSSSSTTNNSSIKTTPSPTPERNPTDSSSKSQSSVSTSGVATSIKTHILNFISTITPFLRNYQNAHTTQPLSTRSSSTSRTTSSKQTDNKLDSATRVVDISFQKKTGFALLTADNHRSPISPNLNVVFGDLILRDGAYRTQRDVSLRLTGVYELSSGTLVVAGDVMYNAAANVLSHLYHSFKTSRPPVVNDTDYFNVSESDFIEALKPRVEKYQKQFRVQRATAPQATGVAAQCPFTATFSITPGNFDDSIPPDSDSSSGTATGITGGVSPFAAAVDGRNPSTITDPGAASSVTSVPSMLAGRADGFDDGVSAQEEYVEMKGRFVSKTCRTEMTIVLATLDTETLFGKAINYTLLVTIVAFIQVIVLIRQMEMTSTQAGARRVSLMTVGLQAVADSYLCLGHLTMGIAVQTLFNAFATAAFFKFICFSIFLMRWMLLIWKARRPSGFSEGWEAMRRELSMLYSRFYGALLIGILLLYQLQNHVRLFVFALYSFWVPQIILNAVEDHRRPLLPVYVIGTSITRLAIPLYFWGCPHNFLHIEPQPAVAVALVAWLSAQAVIILSQYKFGPRWFIPKEFLPEKYDYFRAVAVEDDDVIDLEASENGINRPLVRVEHAEARRECCICMESVAVHSRDRMVTPCNHFFHAACLERWLEVRLECALCRSPVPPP